MRNIKVKKSTHIDCKMCKHHTHFKNIFEEKKNIWAQPVWFSG